MESNFFYTIVKRISFSRFIFLVYSLFILCIIEMQRQEMRGAITSKHISRVCLCLMEVKFIYDFALQPNAFHTERRKNSFVYLSAVIDKMWIRFFISSFWHMKISAFVWWKSVWNARTMSHGWKRWCYECEIATL